MPEYTISPFKGFGPIDFEMTHDEVRLRLGEPQNTTWEGKRWWYHDVGLAVDFDSEWHCKFIESFDPCVPVLGQLHLKGTFDDVIQALVAMGYRGRRGMDTETGSTYFDEIGVLVYQHDAEEGSQTIDSIAAWRRGYWA